MYKRQDIDSLLVSQPDTGEQAMEICEALVRSGDCGAVFILYGRCAAIQMVVLRLSGIIITNRGTNYNHCLLYTSGAVCELLANCAGFAPVLAVSGGVLRHH